MRMFGVETEYALAGSRPRAELITELMDEADARLPHVPNARRRDLFLQNGARFYVDCGSHPEMTTPECTHPSEIVRYIAAGEAILSDLVVRIDAKRRRSKTSLFKCNVDYSGTRATWGCHESYLHRTDPEALPDQIVPHLVSRLAFTGAGGFDSTSPGLDFTLSPRVAHLKRVVSDESTHSRGIVHTKDEPLSAGGYHRLHLVCGESLCSQVASWLKVGTTALVVALVEAGHRPGDDVALRYPLKSMRVIASDERLRKKVAVRAGRRMTAVEIQRHYLEQVEAHLGDAFLPDWAEDVCRVWRDMLDRLESRSGALAMRLDWALKRALFVDQAQRRGFCWDEVPHWSHATHEIEKSLHAAGFEHKPVSVRRVFGRTTPVPRTAAYLREYLKEHSLDQEALPEFLRLRNELFEMDMRFGQVGDGLFASLDRAGVLEHEAPGVGAIEPAITDPPSAGRANVRGRVIRRLAKGKGHRCDWGSVWCIEEKRLLDLSDPFETEERWRDFAPRRPRPAGQER